MLSDRPPSPLKIAANRRNALQSTGPRTAAGKRCVALNARSHGLIPEEWERQLVARSEDAGEFRRLHRDLIAIFHPEDRRGSESVLLMAQTHSLRSGQAWWDKARRIRDSAAAGPARVDDLDKSLELSLGFLIYVQGQRHERWHRRLVAVLGRPLGGPADVRRKIEARLLLFGAKPGQRKHPRVTLRDLAFEQFLKEVKPILAGAVAAGTSVAGALGLGDSRPRGIASFQLPIADSDKATEGAARGGTVNRPSLTFESFASSFEGKRP